jgi:hypothetical protein
MLLGIASTSYPQIRRNKFTSDYLKIVSQNLFSNALSKIRYFLNRGEKLRKPIKLRLLIHCISKISYKIVKNGSRQPALKRLITRIKKGKSIDFNGYLKKLKKRAIKLTKKVFARILSTKKIKKSLIHLKKKYPKSYKNVPKIIKLVKKSFYQLYKDNRMILVKVFTVQMVLNKKENFLKKLINKRLRVKSLLISSKRFKNSLLKIINKTKKITKTIGKKILKKVKKLISSNLLKKLIKLKNKNKQLSKKIIKKTLQHVILKVVSKVPSIVYIKKGICLILFFYD